MKSSKLWRIIWVVGIYLILAVVLYLVILYKVKWEYKDLNTYLYFYDCNNLLCTTTNEMDNYYSKILCEEDVCPYIDTIIGNNTVLRENNSSWIYNYIDGNIINNDYVNYNYIGNNNYIVTDYNNNQGVIDIDGNILVTPKYKNINNYNKGYISFIENNLYGIDSVDETCKIEPIYEDVVLINDSMFAAKADNIYQLYSYNNLNPINNNKYNFVNSYNNAIVVIANNKIDILDKNLNSTLLLKINTFYSYTTEQERDSLNIYSDGENIYFKVYTDEFNYNNYVYSINGKKLI